MAIFRIVLVFNMILGLVNATMISILLSREFRPRRKNTPHNEEDDTPVCESSEP